MSAPDEPRRRRRATPPPNREGRLRDQFFAKLSLLTLLPRRHPGAPWELIVVDLEISRRTFFRILADLREVGFTIESAVLPDGRRGYFLTGGTGMALELLKRLGLA